MTEVHRTPPAPLLKYPEGLEHFWKTALNVKFFFEHFSTRIPEIIEAF